MNETPKPVEFNELNIQFQKEVISDKNNKYLVCFKADSYSELIIKAKTDDIIKMNYINKFSVEYIRNNKYFMQFDNLKEICEEIYKRLKKGKIALFEENNSIIISILLPTITIKEIKFELKEDTINDKINDKINNTINENNKINDKINDTINDTINVNYKINDKTNNTINENNKRNDKINDKINNTINENNKINDKINDKTNDKINDKINDNYNNKEIISKLLTLIYSPREEIKKLKNTVNELNEFKKEYLLKNYISNLDSLIVNNKEYNAYLKSWINPNLKIKANLLYRLSRDGVEISTFHKLCDNKGSHLVLFHIIDGNKVGYFGNQSLDSYSGWVTDDFCFIFNLNQGKKYKKLLNDTPSFNVI